MSIRSLPTLKGVFPQPKPAPKRDFMKENKQKLKAIQKFSVQKQINNVENDEHCTRRSQQRRKEEVMRSRSIPSKRITSGCSCVSKNSQTCSTGKNEDPRIRITTSCDKSIQTDDIIDETFLSNALRRCSSRDSPKDEYADEAFPRKLPYIMDSSSREDNILNVDLLLDEHDHLPDLPESALYKCDSKNGLQDIQCDKLCRVQNKNSNRSDLRSRKEIKIPKYLEREKREKELQRIREMEKDPQCPDGHYALSDDDRKEALKTAENQFKELIDELNRMPMSSETLRIRNRKMEIEKALIKLENNIRTFSKQKVYVKTDK